MGSFRLHCDEWFGYVLSGNAALHKVLMFIGPPRSGKSTIARILSKLAGIANVAYPTLSAFGSQFEMQNLIGKSLAIISDARPDG